MLRYLLLPKEGVRHEFYPLVHEEQEPSTDFSSWTVISVGAAWAVKLVDVLPSGWG
jgi:hypothetical protein